MMFLNPNGLWLLLGIPVLIIIYLIKNQHEDKQVSSTYIWKLSSKFAKKRLPIQRLRKFILFLLQLLLIAAAAIIAGKPAVNNGQSYDYIVIIDGSASMQQEDDEGVSRFAHAIKSVEEMGDDLKNGHSLTVILATDDPICLVESSVNPTEVKTALSKATCSFGGCNEAAAMELAQEKCDRVENPSVIFYTDKKHRNVGNIKVEAINPELWNVSVEAVKVDEDDKETVFTGTVISYNKDVSLAVGLRIDGKTTDATIVDCKNGVEQQVEFRINDLTSFDVAEIYVENDDGLDADNCYAYCKKDHRKYSVLIVSPSPLYLQSAFEALGNCNVKVEYGIEKAPNAGCDLYVYDGIYPEEYPTDGSVIQFGTDKMPDGLTKVIDYDDDYIIYSNMDAGIDICKNISFKNAVVKNYSALIGNSQWHSLILCKGVTVMSTREMTNGIRFSVFSFDIHDSNLPLKSDFLVLMKNLVEYSIPSMMTKTDYVSGESVVIDILPFTESLYLEYPDNTMKELYSGGDSVSVKVDMVGVYTSAIIKEDGGEYVDFFVHIPEGETAKKEGADIGVTLADRDDAEIKEVYSPIWIWIALGALFIILLEWGWYYREQY